MKPRSVQDGRVRTRWLLLALTAVLFAACSGDSDQGGPAAQEEPAGQEEPASQEGGAGQEGGASQEGGAAADRAILMDPGHPAWSEPAPDTFEVHVETTAGTFVIEVVRAWAPVGADRFYNLVRRGYYDDVRFHRVVPGFITQWGVSGDPALNAVWYDRGIPDDPVVASNVRGTIAYAFTEPGTRSTQVYINMVDNERLDADGFAPFGRVVEGMASVVDSLYSGYGEESGGGVRRGDQSRIVAEGNAYLDAEWPRLDRLLSARVVR